MLPIYLTYLWNYTFKLNDAIFSFTKHRRLFWWQLVFTKLWPEKFAMDKLYKLKLGADLLTTPAWRERALYKIRT